MAIPINPFPTNPNREYYEEHPEQYSSEPTNVTMKMDNTTPFEPIDDYNPTSKKYVDEHSGAPTDEQVAQAVEQYLEAHPVTPYDDTEIREDIANIDDSLVDITNSITDHETRIEALEQGGGGGGSVVTIADNPNGGVDITVNGNKRTVAKESELSNLVTTDTFTNKTTSIENDIDTIDDTVSTMSNTLVTVVETQTEHTQEIADLFGIIGGIDDILGSGVFE